MFEPGDDAGRRIVLIVLALVCLCSRNGGWTLAAGFDDTRDGARLELVRPEGASAWMFPVPGEQNECLPGHVEDVYWAPSGRWGAVEVSGTRSRTLCLYKLSRISTSSTTGAAAGAALRVPVTVYRLSEVGSGFGTGRTTGRQGSSSDEAILGRFGAPEVSFDLLEHEVRWAPGVGTGVYPWRLVYTLEKRGMPRQVVGVANLAFGSPRIERVGGRLDAGGPGRGSLFQPVFRPRGGDDRAGITVVTDSGLKCGRSRIAHITGLGCRGGDCRPKLIFVSDPCRSGPGSEDENAADRYPAWDPAPGPEHDRLAFVRVLPGVRSQVCVRTRPLEPARSGMACFEPDRETRAVSRMYPVWSTDGRYLAYFEVAANDSSPGTSAEASADTSVRVVDTSAASCRESLSRGACKPRTVTSGIRVNSHHGPTLTTRDGRTSLVVIQPVSGLHSAVSVIDVATGDVLATRDTGLQNIRSIDLVEAHAGMDATAAREVRIGLVAQGYRGQKRSDQVIDKLFLLTLSGDWEVLR